MKEQVATSEGVEMSDPARGEIVRCCACSWGLWGRFLQRFGVTDEQLETDAMATGGRQEARNGFCAVRPRKAEPFCPEESHLILLRSSHLGQDQ